jgi:bifunctional DNA-binding transcriptional regulator/antitoxin component of YhaV-PrlF toxin-antitoxin module
MTIRTATATVPALKMPAIAPSANNRVDSRPAPPVPALPAAIRKRVASSSYALARIDHRGRVTDAAIERALGWPPGTRLNIQETGGVLVVSADDRGVFTMSSQSHVCLPQPVRRWCHLNTGDQVLLVVGQAADRLIVYPAPRLDELLAGSQRTLFGGAQ